MPPRLFLPKWIEHEFPICFLTVVLFLFFLFFCREKHGINLVGGRVEVMKALGLLQAVYFGSSPDRLMKENMCINKTI